MLHVQQPHEHSHGVALHWGKQHSPGGQQWQPHRRLLLAGSPGRCELHKVKEPWSLVTGRTRDIAVLLAVHGS